MNISEIKEILKSRLSEKRYNHSIGTMKAAIELARMYGENEEEAAFAGLIHDIAKEMSKDEIINFIDKYNVEVDEIERNQMGLLHSKFGSVIAREEFGASEKIQNAIKYHTTGNIKMDLFAKIIFLADKIEETRTYDDVYALREICKVDLDKAIVFVLDIVTQKSIKKSELIHLDTIEFRNYLLMNCK